MSNLRQAAQQALEALEWIEPSGLTGRGGIDARSKAITALRAALAEPEQEPVAYLWQHDETGRTRIIAHDEVWTASNRWHCIGPLYLGSAPTPRKPLTDEEIEEINRDLPLLHMQAERGSVAVIFARAIERAPGIGGDA